MTPLLAIRNLTVGYGNGTPALNGVTFDLHQGEILGVLGESGSGKTTLGFSILGLLPPGGRIIRGSIGFRDRDLSSLGERELEALRGSEISMIFQEPELALNPFLCALEQVQEVIRAHHRWPGRQCREEAMRVLAEVRLAQDPRLPSAYPHQLSGGERQRLVIAQALACKPALLIADEPVAALDSVLQAEWVGLIKDLRERHGLALLLITHDPSILAGLADRVLVLYAGRVVEDASLEQILGRPLHPYTRALLRAMPSVRAGEAKKRLPVIAGSLQNSVGCPFEPRCPDRLPVCSREEPPEVMTEELGRVRCFHYVQ